MKINSFEQANKYLQSFYTNSRNDYSLDNMIGLMEFLDNPQHKYRVIHVAGTSGKTSTAYYISALLTASGSKTGLTVSPHVDQLNERLQINSKPVSEEVFCSAMTGFSEMVEESKIEPSWFEVMMAFAYWYFAEVGVEYAVIEVGLGGLKDASNVISRSDKICVITDIGLDHVNILGTSLPEIAAQKIGIVQSGNTVFTYLQQNAVMEVYKNFCAQKTAELVVIADPQIQSSNIAHYQQRNWSLAYSVYAYVEVSSGLRSLNSHELEQTMVLQVPGRMDVQTIGNKHIVMDGAHNKQKMAAFIESYTSLYPSDKPVLLVGFKEEREYAEIIPLLKQFSDHIITTEFSSTQDLPIAAMSAQRLASGLVGAGVPKVECYPDLKQAYDVFIRSPESNGVITGSFYLVSEMRKLTSRRA